MSTIMDGDVEVGGDFARETPKAVKHEPPVEAVAEEPAAEEALELTEDDEIVDEPADDGRKASHGLPAKERIAQLNAEKRALERQVKALAAAFADSRPESLEKLRGDEIKLPTAATIDNISNQGAPDPTDSAKYPLGSLDDRYIEDLAEFKIEQKLVARHQRQVEDARAEEARRIDMENLQKAQTIVAKGSELYDDYEQVVWKAGIEGRLKMTDVVFQAITEAEHGEKIAYALGKNLAEADRLFGLTPYQQLKYIDAKNAEFAAKEKPRLPKAGSPPAYQARGASGKYEVDPTTDDLGAFKRALFT